MSRSARAIPIDCLGPHARQQVDNVLYGAAVQKALRAEKKANKYGAKRVQIDGIWFDSKAEGDRWCELRIEERAGIITDLRRQVPYPIIVNDNPITKWIADFQYLRDGQLIAEDVKGCKTKEYVIKAKLVQALYGIRILETKA